MEFAETDSSMRSWQEYRDKRVVMKSLNSVFTVDGGKDQIDEKGELRNVKQIVEDKFHDKASKGNLSYT